MPMNDAWRGPLRWGWKFLAPFLPVVFALSFFSLFSNLLDTVEPMLTGRIIDSLSSKDVRLFWTSFLYVVSIQLSGLCLSLLYTWLNLLFQKKVTVYSESRMYQVLLKGLPSSIQQGKVLTLFQSDLPTMTSIYLNQIPGACIAAITLIVLGFRLLQIDLLVFLITVVMSVVPLLLADHYGKCQAKVNDAQREIQEKYSLFLIESTNGMSEIQNSGSRRNFRKKFENVISRIFKLMIGYTKISMRSSLATFGTNFVSSTVLLLIVGYSVLNGRNTVGAVVAALLYSERFRKQVKMLAGSYQNLLVSLVSARRIRDFFDTQSGHVSYLEYRPQEATGAPAVKLERLGFCYRENEPVLRNLDWSFVSPGLYLVKGENGSGKTTLLNLLAGYLPDYHAQGRIVYTGMQRGQVAYVSQHPAFFSTTIRDNIAMGKEVRNEDILDILHRVHLFQVIEQLPEGLDTVMGDGGFHFSQGQSQRLALARALLHDSRLLLFDEIENALDKESVDALLSILSELMDTKLIVMITHRDTYDHLAAGTLLLPGTRKGMSL